MARHMQGTRLWSKKAKAFALVGGALAVFVGIAGWEVIGSARQVHRELTPFVSTGLSASAAKASASVASMSLTGGSMIAASASPRPVAAAPVAAAVSKGAGVATAHDVPTWVPPVPGPILQGFGWAYSPVLGDWQLHTGVDLASTAGEAVDAPATGMVAAVRDDPLWGWVVSITLPGGYSSNVSGLAKATVSVGQSVRVGQEIGVAAATSPPAEANLPPHIFWQTFSIQGPVAPAA